MYGMWWKDDDSGDDIPPEFNFPRWPFKKRQPKAKSKAKPNVVGKKRGGMSAGQKKRIVKDALPLLGMSGAMANVFNAGTRLRINSNFYP